MRLLGRSGLPLGAGSGVGAPQPFQLQPGELLWAFSDGLNELPTPSGRELGMRRVATMLRKTDCTDMEQVRTQLLERIDAEAAMHEREDDLTFVLIRRH